LKFKPYIASVINAVQGKPVMFSRDDRGWSRTGTGGTYGEFKSNDYENAYPSITKINNKFMKIKPFAVDENGNKVEVATSVINALYHPNKINSSVEFREALSLMYLVHPKTHILVWRKENGKIFPGGNITAKNIAGFSFMEGVAVARVGGVTTYTVTTENGTTNKYDDSEVITLRGLNPYRINTGGFSAIEAARKWTTIDDYIAQYQKGFFENGAVPAGEFIITAPTPKEFNDIVDRLQATHKGASKNNNVVYTHRPVDLNTGKPADAQIEWVPFGVSNRELSLKDLFEQANKKIDSAFGVPASIRGVGENNNFATARTDQQNFMENVVEPLTLKIWTGFTHELNRITGGLGVAIGFDIDIPALADEELVIEERGKVRDERVQAWLEKGYSLSSIKKYLESGDIEDLEVKEVTDENEDDPDVDEGGEVNHSADPNNPTPNNIEGKDPKGIYAPNGRYLGKKLGNGLIEIKNPTDKTPTVVKI
jgi:phage portal protein BeeE